MSDLKDTIFKFSKAVTKTSNTLLKTTALSVKLANEEDSLKSIYVELGKKVHEIYAFGGTLGKFFDEKYEELQRCEARIKELRDELELVKGTKACPKCGKMNEYAAEFCTKCGTRMSGVSEAAPYAPIPLAPPEMDTVTATEPGAAGVGASETDTAAQREVVTERVCRSCNAKNYGDTKFCLTCGRML